MNEKIFNVIEYGAIADGETLCTAALQKAIDECHAAGGGTIVFPEGVYVLSTVFMKSNVRIHITKNALILGAPSFYDYAPQEKIDYPLYQDASHSYFDCSMFVAKGCENMVMITLGTGVGGGIVAEGMLLEGNKSAGAELGHMVIVANGEQCTCGRKGCLEAYSSATALIRDTKRAMEAHKDSKMWEIGSLDKVTGKTAFDYRETDPYAKEVVDAYIEHLAFGITNVANIFRPETVLLGGGVCAEGDNLVKPLQKLLDRDIFAGELGPQVSIRIAELGNSAGLLGAAALWM